MHPFAWVHVETLKVKDEKRNINFAINASSDNVSSRSPDVHHGEDVPDVPPAGRRQNCAAR